MNAKVSARSGYKEYMKVTVAPEGQALLGDLFPCYGGEYFTEDDANSTSELMLTFEAMKNGECGDNPNETHVWIKPLEVVAKEERAEKLTQYDWDYDRYTKARHESHINQATVVIRRDFDWKRDEDGQLITPMSSGDRFFHCRVSLPCQHWDHPEKGGESRFSGLNFDVTFKTTTKQYRKFPHREIAARALNNALKLLAARRAELKVYVNEAGWNCWINDRGECIDNTPAEILQAITDKCRDEARAELDAKLAEEEAPSTRLDVTALFTGGPAPEGLLEAIRAHGKPAKEPDHIPSDREVEAIMDQIPAGFDDAAITCADCGAFTRECESDGGACMPCAEARV